MTIEEAKASFPPAYVIYRKPADYPDRIVVRVFYGNVPGDGFIFSPESTVDDARIALMNRGCSCVFDRDSTDDPVIVETWI